MARKPREILDLIRDREIKAVDFTFADATGRRQRTTMFGEAVDEEMLVRGVAFDPSGIRGFSRREPSEVLLRPDLDAACVDTFRNVPALALVCDVVDPSTKRAHDGDVRAIARRAEAFLAQSGVAETAYFAPRAEFSVFDRVVFENAAYSAGYEIDGDADDGSPQSDVAAMDLLAEMALGCKEWGVDVQSLHRDETSRHSAIGIRSGTLLATADRVLALRYVVQQTAARYEKIATFMPKPANAEPGSGMPVRHSLWKGTKPLFFDGRGYAECSQTMLFYVGGVLKHLGSLAAFFAPETNSYKRMKTLRPGPMLAAFSAHDRSAAVGVATAHAGDPKAKELDFRLPDGSCTPHLAFAALLCAGLDGVKNKIDPVKAGFGPIEPGVRLNPAAHDRLDAIPASLRESLLALDSDRTYLTKDGVFTDAFIDAWIEAKDAEVRAIEISPHPHEFTLYFGTETRARLAATATGT